MTHRAAELEPSLHRAMVAWQEKHFQDFPYLAEHWAEHYRQAPFRLEAKFRPMADDERLRFRATRQMDEERLERARSIIRAQASTELGSIQQHRESLHKAADPAHQFHVLRVMAEEYRHGYQMIYLLAGDDWGSNVARDTIEELLAMETGSHVLDAFNVFFDSFVDNIVFAAVIDRVGKYQLTMQKIFAYAPMAESMPPMLTEEAFHLATGVGPMKQWVRDAALDRGNVPVASLQRHLNKWIPRGLEMFGDERGGETNVRLGFKNLNNEDAAAQYHKECAEQVVDPLNIEIVRARAGREMPPEEALSHAREVLERGESVFGLSASDLLRLPARNFFRRRGVHAFAMAGPDGNAIADEATYLKCLRECLPEAYVSGRDFSTYIENLRRHHAGAQVQETQLPFFG